MMRSQRIGRRYLAGFIMVAGFLYFLLVCGTVAMRWPTQDHSRLAFLAIALGLVPSAAIIFQGRRAWSEAGGGSTAMSVAALVILLLLTKAASLI